MGRFLGQAQYRYIANIAPTTFDISTNTTLQPNSRYFVNTSSAAVTLTLPQSPPSGAFVEIIDAFGTWDVKNCVVNPSGDGSAVAGFTDNLTIDLAKANIRLSYSSALNNWVITDSL